MVFPWFPFKCLHGGTIYPAIEFPALDPKPKVRLSSLRDAHDSEASESSELAFSRDHQEQKEEKKKKVTSWDRYY